MIFRQIAFATADYKLELRLRDELLRKPLGLSLGDADLTEERSQLHFGLFEPPDSLVACVTAVPLSSIEAKIRQMAVSAPYQGRGIGKRLMDELERDLRSRGFKHFVLNARASAVGFYEQLGYRVVGDEFVEVTLPHFRMVKAA